MNETVSSTSSKNNPIILCDVLDALQKQKLGKSVGYDGIEMEAFIYNGQRLVVHFVLSLISICLSNMDMYHCLLCNL